MQFNFEEIESCEKIGKFNDEYVYDVEVDDDTHTFIGNNILVHNSTYITLKPAIESCDWNGGAKEFCLKLTEVKLNDYIEKRFDEYAKRYNTKNLQALELEKVSYSGLMLSKKKYVLDLGWKDPGLHYKPQEKISSTGIEIIQSSTPKYVRKVLKEMLNLIFKKNKDLKFEDLINALKKYKESFILQNPDDISLTGSIGDYEKYILEDKKDLKIASKCPIHVKAAGVYNYNLFNTKYKSKYSVLNTADKVKYYYAKNEQGIFGFIPGDYPYEFAPEMDYDKQFERTIITPINRYIKPIGFNSIPGNLVYSRSLF